MKKEQKILQVVKNVIFLYKYFVFKQQNMFTFRLHVRCQELSPLIERLFFTKYIQFFTAKMLSQLNNYIFHNKKLT